MTGIPLNSRIGWQADIIRHIPKFTGEIWYADTGIVASGNGMSPDQAFQTITEGIAAMAAGDALAIKAGTYDENGLDLNLNGLELWGEIGTIIVNSNPGTCLTVSGNSCRVRDVRLVQAGQTGLAVTGDSAWIENVVTEVCTIGYDIDGDECVLIKTASHDHTVTGYDISGEHNIIQDSASIVPGSATRGYYLSAASADLNLLDRCTSAGNQTSGFEIVTGANNNIMRDCVSGGGDGERVDAGNLNMWVLSQERLQKERHEEVYPFPDGEGTAGNAIAVTSDAEDETHAAATTKDYFGEPYVIIPVTTIPDLWNFIGANIYSNTTNKDYRSSSYRINYILRSAKNAGNAWDEGETQLTVVDGSIFATSDLVWIYSAYKTNGEIVRVTGVAANVVTIERETSQFGVPNTGLRWDHTTNNPGTEIMYLVFRSSSREMHENAFDFSTASAKDFIQIRWHTAREMSANDGLLLRVQNGTDGTNGGGYSITAIYEDGT
jgi:hypothetical protein